jgi:hypothetical protein
MDELLYEYGYDVFSSCGEDGINQKLFEHLKIKSGIVLEIGAWDGFYCSNCANVWSKDKNFKGILVEATNRLNKENLESQYENIECFNVRVDNENTLEKIIDDSKFEVKNSNFVLCSIDVDGPDLEVVNSLGKYKPKILILECNGCFVEKTNPIGMTMQEWVCWGNENNYEFIGMSGVVDKYAGNMYFIRSDLKKKFKVTNLDWKKRGILLSLDNERRYGVVYEE